VPGKNRTMVRLTYLAVLFLTCSAEPRSPRIYNVLISSKKNLSPSHAQPVYEPVLRTTSIGYAFPSLFYHTSFVQNVPTTYINPDYSGFTKIDTTYGNQQEAKPNAIQYPTYAPIIPANTNQNINNNPLPETSQYISKESDGNQPAHVGQFVPQYDPYALGYSNYLPKEQESDPGKHSQVPIPSQQREETDPKRVIANLKKNPEIPDVPPPPLPVKVTQSE